MEAQDIRLHSEKMFDEFAKGLARDNNVDSVLLSAQMQIMQACWEIAAQLSEIRNILSRPS